MVRYKKGGYAYPSVTEIIKDCTSQPWMAPWVTKEMMNELLKGEGITVTHGDVQEARWAYKKVGDDAAKIGTEVHDIIEFYFKKGALKEGSCDEVNNAIDNFEIWNDKYQPKAIATEIKVYGNGWAGTADFLGWIDDRLWVLDWKTSKAHHPLENGPQISAYRWAIYKKTLSLAEEKALEAQDLGGDFYQSFEMFKDEYCPSKSGIVRFDKVNKYTDKDFKDYSDKYEHYLRQWELMVELFFLRHPIIRKKSGRKGE